MATVSTTNNPWGDKAALWLENAFIALSTVLFAVLPLHAFLVTWLRFGLGISAPLNAWKEGLVIVLALIAMLRLALAPRRPRPDALDWAVGGLVVIGIVSAILQWTKLGDDAWVRIAYGFKYDFLMLGVFMLFRHGVSDAHRLQRAAMRALVVTGAIVLAFAVLQATLLPRDFLLRFGYSPVVSSWNPDGAPAIYHGLDKGSTAIRIASTFAGPNQFGMYCLILLGLFATMVQPGPSIRWHRAGLCILAGLSIFGVVASFSRSALLGLLVGTFVMAIITARQRGWTLQALRPWVRGHLRPLLVGGTVLVIVTSILIPSSFWHAAILRVSSSQGHWERSLDGIMYTFDKPLLGHGIGDAGPASARWDPQGIGWIPESWYLQISLQYGLIGLAFYLAILLLVAKNLHTRINAGTHGDWLLSTGLLFSFIAINVACLTLHAWEDSAVALTWWGLAGLALSNKTAT